MGVNLLNVCRMEITEAYDIAKDFLATHNIINCGCMHYTYREKGSLLPSGRQITDDEWSLCFYQDEEEGVVSSGNAIIVIVDVQSKTARYLSTE